MSGTVCCRVSVLSSWRRLAAAVLLCAFLVPVAAAAGEKPVDEGAAADPDQGQGWQAPGTAVRKPPRLAKPVPRRAEPVDEDAAADPDQDQGWQIPGTAARKKPRPEKPVPRRAEPVDEDAAADP
ncbi:MAG: hypothetical protein ACE5FR_01895, partial [Rhodospirillales bacterium]